jgi:hypothetical protein
LALLFGVPTGLLLLAVLLSRLGALDVPLRATLAALSERLGGRVEPSRVRLGLFPPRLTCERLALSTPDGEIRLLELEGLDLRALPGGAALSARGGALHLVPAWSRLRPEAPREPEPSRRAPLGFGLSLRELRLLDGARELGRVDLYAARRPWPAQTGGSGGLRFAAAQGAGRALLRFEWDGAGAWSLESRLADLAAEPLWPETLLGSRPGSALSWTGGRVAARLSASGSGAAWQVEGQGRLSDASAVYEDGEVRLEGLDFDLAAAGIGARIETLSAWSEARLLGRLAEQRLPLALTVEAERSGPVDPGAWRIEFETPSLPVGAEFGLDLARRLNERGLERIGRELANAFQGLDPGGEVRALGAARLEGLAAPRIDRLAIQFEPDRRMSLRYVGWPEDSGERHGFPLRARELEGRVLLGVEPRTGRGFELALIGVQARHASGVVLGNGWIGSRLPAERGLRRDPRVLLRLEVPSLAVGPELFEGLAGLGAGFELERFLELDAGEASAVVRLDGTRQASGVGIQVDASFRGVSGRARELPAPFAEASGVLALRYTTGAFPRDPRPGERAGREAGLALAARGRLAEQPETELGFRLGLRQERLPEGSRDWRRLALEVDALQLPSPAFDLALAREPEAQDSLAEIAPSGRLSARLERTENPGAAVHERLALETKDLVLGGLGQLAPLVWAGSARVERETPRSDAPRDPAESPPSRPRLAARFASAPAGRGSLLAEARLAPGLELDLCWDGASLSDPALAELAGLAPDSGPPPLGGRFDLRADLAPDRPPEATLWLRHSRLAQERFELDALNGRLSLSRRGLSGELLEGRLERTPVVLKDLELVPPDAGGAARASGQLWVTDLPLDAEHLSAWLSPEQLDSLFEGSRWRGTLDILGAEFRAERDRAGNLEASLSGPLVPHDVYLEVGVPLRFASARLLLGQMIFSEGRLRGFAEISELYGSIADRSISNLAGVLTYSDGRLQLSDVSGQFCSGALSSRGGQGTLLQLDLTSGYPLELALELEGASVRELLRELFPGQIDNRGELDLELRLSGEPAAPLSWQGDGSLRLFNARLWSVPVIRELFGVLGFDATATFDWMRTRFHLERGSLRLDQAVAHSPLFNLVGGGRLDLDGRLDQTYTLSYALVDRLGLLSRLFYFFQDRVVTLRISGDMARPEVRLQNILTRLFGSEPERLPRPAPPPPRGLPERF